MTNAEAIEILRSNEIEITGTATMVCNFLEALYMARKALSENGSREGEWLFHDDGSGTCTACHRAQKAVWDDDHHQRYCGCCGAKMKGGESDA